MTTSSRDSKIYEICLRTKVVPPDCPDRCKNYEKGDENGGRLRSASDTPSGFVRCHDPGTVTLANQRQRNNLRMFACRF